MNETTTYKSFEKKIIPYLDGSLSKDELQEFEAFVMTHPEFETVINNKKAEVDLIKKLIPAAVLSSDAKASLESEFKTSIMNLLKEEPKGFVDRIKLRWEEWSSR
jgi:hypothetical protein